MMNTPSSSRLGYVLCRYVAAALLLLYGFAKINGAQFTVLDSELDKPLREVSGFWLTWYYFGFSRVYGAFLALVQIGGAIALLVRRTALIGALVLCPVIGNIILIDVFYGIDCGALIAALVIATCLFRILFEHRERLSRLLLPSEPARNSRRIVAAVVSTAMALGAFSFTYYVAHYNNRRPTAIDGTWAVTGTAGASTPPTHVYFERNRAAMCVFRYPDRTSTHHFELDRSTVRIWTTWLRKGSLLLEGTYDSARKTIVLTGRLPETKRLVQLELKQLRGPTI